MGGWWRRARPPVWPRARAPIAPGGAPAPSPAAEQSAPARSPRPRRASRPRRALARALPLLLAFGLLAAAGAGAALWSLGATQTNYPGPHFNTGQNAVWLEHAWAGQAHAPGEYDALARRLRAEQIGYVFAHVGPLDSGGAIPADRAPNAAALAAELHARLPDVRVLAWIGQLEAASGGPADEVVSLGDPEVRARIAATAARFTAGGFDGVHYDIEPILNNNAHFLDLLDETRAKLPPGSVLSVAAQKWAPNATAADWLHGLGHADAWWTSYYFAAVAAHADQLVVMAYNTAMPTPRTYQLFVKQQAQHVLEAARSARRPPQVLIGIPTYPGDNRWYHDNAENMASGLAGITAGLNSDRDTSPFAGVAIYRFALTTADDWATYDREWLGR